MPLKKLTLRPGVNKENTRYTTEGGFYDCDKVRFRQGTPEKIGGWERISSNTFLGVCRSLWNWVTLGSSNLIGVGTNLKFYISRGGAYYDVTPLRATNTLSNPFATTSGSSTVVVTDASGGYTAGSFVTFSNASTVGGLDLNGNYQIQQVLSGTTYSITAAANATSTVASGGGTAVVAAYEINAGSVTALPSVGWGGGTWGGGTWGFGSATISSIRLWNQVNYGEDLIYGPRGGALYYWDASVGVNPVPFTVTIASPGVLTTTVAFTDGMAISLTTAGSLPTGLAPGTVYYVVNSTGTTFNLALTAGGTPINTSGTQSGAHAVSQRGVPLTALAGASDVPVVQNMVLVSGTSRFVLVFGTNDYGSTVLDPMLVRWSEQENLAMWTPAATNQAGSIRLSHGSEIITAQQTRQEVLVWTDSALFSMQYIGPPIVWGTQVLADNISIVGPNAAAIGAGITYWMGVDKFYKYDGRVQTLRCDLRRFIFDDINLTQSAQIFAGTSEGFNEVWWFYCSADSDAVDRYVIYNYAEDIWYYGTMARTAWLDSGLLDYPIAATYSNNIVNHEYGLNNNETGTPAAINAYIQSSEFDIDDGHNFAFIWRMLPDVTFRGSTAASPTATMYLYPLANSGSGYNQPGTEQSVGGTSYANVIRTATVPVEQFTGQVNTRVRGRQLAIKIESDQLDTTWQLGSPRIDIRPDGRR